HHRTTAIELLNELQKIFTPIAASDGAEDGIKSQLENYKTEKQQILETKKPENIVTQAILLGTKILAVNESQDKEFRKSRPYEGRLVPDTLSSEMARVRRMEAASDRAARKREKSLFDDSSSSEEQSEDSELDEFSNFCSAMPAVVSTGRTLRDIKANRRAAAARFNRGKYWSPVEAEAEPDALHHQTGSVEGGPSVVNNLMASCTTGTTAVAHYNYITWGE
ncbi:unnamed protein product, partial [Amoebophrya sp. A120]